MFGNDSQFSKAMESTMISSNLEGQFGPWAVFDLAWKSIKGYHAEDFEFVTGKTPLSTLQETLGFILMYYITIFGGREIMRDRKAFKLNGLFMAHNFLLSTGSAALLLLFAGQLLPTLISKGLYANICGSEGWTKPLVTLYYVSLNAPTACIC
jgi:fatty acid elongase 3